MQTSLIHLPQISGQYTQKTRWHTSLPRLMLATLLPILTVVGTTTHGDTYAQKAPAPNAVHAQFDAAVAPHLAAGEPGGAVIVVRDGKAIYRRAFGLSDVANKIAIKPDDVFRLGSITKQFTAVAILMLIDEGKLKLTDDITKHIPNYPAPSKTITIEHLLTHTSGIPSYTGMADYAATMDKDLSTAQMVDRFKLLPLEFDPGSQYRYNNSGYFLLGVIIENLSRMTYAEFLAKRIFTPLNMRDTAYEGVERSGKKRIEGYTRRDGKTVADSAVSMTQPFAAGSLLSTIDDLSTWDAAVTAGKLLKAESWKKVFTDSILNNGRKTGYGYGWQIGALRGELAHAHGGGIPGFSTYAISLPASKTYVAVLTNTTAAPGVAAFVAEKLAAIAIDKPFLAFAAVTLDDTQLDKHIGVYRIDETNLRTITRDGNQLFSERTGARKIGLTPASPTSFFVPNSTTNLKFETDATGETTHLITTQSRGEERNPRISKTSPVAASHFKITNAAFDLYIGKYALAPTFILTISREGDSFYAQATGQGKNEIFAEAENRFALKVVNAKLQFDKDADGKVTQLILFQGGRETPGKRLP